MQSETENTIDLRAVQNLPLGYWETYDARQGGVIRHMSQTGLSIHSHVDMRVGGELRIKIFLSHGLTFDHIPVLTRITRKDLLPERVWETYAYELEILRISEEDRLKLEDHLRVREGRKICF